MIDIGILETPLQLEDNVSVITDPDLYYISVNDVRNAGVSSDPPTDEEILDCISLWQQILERACRQWFKPISIEMYLDGTDSDTIHFSVPIISIRELRINSSNEALDTSLYKVYNGRKYPDDRKNPKIKLIDSNNYQRDIFTSVDRYTRNRFYSGVQNQYIKGVFGYVEQNLSTPAPIKRALLKLVLSDITAQLIQDPSSAISPPPLTLGNIKEEWTDGHSIVYQEPGGTLNPRPPGLMGLINDPAILRIITLYKAPIGVGVPVGKSYV